MIARRLVSVFVCLVVLTGCECGSFESAPSEALSAVATPPNFDRAMADHAALAEIARDALIQGDLEVARQAMRKLAFFMENVPYPAPGQELASVARELATQVRQGRDLEESCMAFARLSYVCGQCHHALDRGPPMKLDVAPTGPDVSARMQRHYWAIERMWEALLSDSPRTFQKAARTLAEAPLQGNQVPDDENPPGVTRLAFEVHDLAFAAAVEGSNAADDYVPEPGERRESQPTSRGQAEIFGQLLYTCSQCHQLTGVKPALPHSAPGKDTP
ncbi:MAG: hypothetical protein WBG86_00455 [Polyangiales bacterium]